MVVTDVGITTSLSKGFWANALGAITVSCFEIVTVANCGLAWKHISPIVFTVLGIVNEMSASQPLKALLPRLSTTQSLAKVTEVNPFA